MTLSNDIIPEVCGFNGEPNSDKCILSAKDDRSALLSWLQIHIESKNTYSSYCKEVDRFYRWMHIVKGRPVSSMTHEDFIDYRLFLKDPQPAGMWVSSKKLPRSNKEWKPFFGPLMPSSIKQSILILDSLFSWLVQTNYLNANPISLTSKRDRKSPKRKLQRYLTWNSVSEIHNLFDEIANQDVGLMENKSIPLPTKKTIKKLFVPGSKTLARCRWIFSALFLTGLRISELASATTKNINTQSVNGVSYSWLTIIGKGGVERSIPLSRDFLNEYLRYKESLSLHNEQLKYPPLVMSLQENVKVEPLTRSTLHRIVKTTSELVSIYLSSIGRFDESEKIKNLSAHWLRHSYASALADSGSDQRTVKENLGHNSLETSSIYMHIDSVKRHNDSQIGMGQGTSHLEDNPY